MSASAVTVNRFCSSGLQAIAIAAERIMAGFATAIVAGGTESMSLVPMGGHKIVAQPDAGRQLSGRLPDHRSGRREPRARARRHARGAGRVRAAQPPARAGGHRRRPVRRRDRAAAGPRWHGESAADRRQTRGRAATRRIEALGKLRPAFHVKGTVTAGNSSQTSDGAAAVVVMDGARARELGLAPLARFVAFATAGVEPERFGIGPVPAVRKALKLAGLTLDDIDLVELNEAFAAQVIACLRELPIDPERLNVNGGAIALGHPLGCTGAKLTATLLHEMRRRERAIRPGHDVRRRRHGRGGNFRAHVVAVELGSAGRRRQDRPRSDDDDHDNGNPRRRMADRGDRRLASVFTPERLDRRASTDRPDG